MDQFLDLLVLYLGKGWIFWLITTFGIAYLSYKSIKTLDVIIQAIDDIAEIHIDGYATSPADKVVEKLKLWIKKRTSKMEKKILDSRLKSKGLLKKKEK